MVKIRAALIICIASFTLFACSNENTQENEPLKGEKEVIEMIKDKIDFHPNADNKVEMYKREGDMDKKVTIFGDGTELKKRVIQSEIPYELFNMETKEEMEVLLQDEITAYRHINGIIYEIDFFDAYFYEEIEISYDELDVEKYEEIEEETISQAEKDRDFLYMIRDYVERAYHFID